MKWWKVTFTEKGTIDTIRQVEADAINSASIVFIYCETLDKARKAAYNVYCARKKKEAKTRLHEAGKCCCGRKQDRKHPNGSWMLTCSTCAERQKGWNSDSLARKKEGITDHKRDEEARTSACSARTRDRKAEMRMEVLVEVRNQWENSKTMGQFTLWLKEELEKCQRSRSN